jgi:hypothetical protein
MSNCAAPFRTGARRLGVLLSREGIQLLSGTIHRILLRCYPVRELDPATKRSTIVERFIQKQNQPK